MKNNKFEQIQFLKEQVQMVKNQDQILMKIEVLLIKMRELAEIALYCNIENHEVVSINKQINKLKTEVHLLEELLKITVH